jgi:hypothetical protein
MRARRCRAASGTSPWTSSVVIRARNGRTRAGPQGHALTGASQHNFHRHPAAGPAHPHRQRVPHQRDPPPGSAVTMVVWLVSAATVTGLPDRRAATAPAGSTGDRAVPPLSEARSPDGAGFSGSGSAVPAAAAGCTCPEFRDAADDEAEAIAGAVSASTAAISAAIPESFRWLRMALHFGCGAYRAHLSACDSVRHRPQPPVAGCRCGLPPGRATHPEQPALKES